MKLDMNRNFIKLFLGLFVAGLFFSCASNKYPQKKRKKRCNDCPRFSEQFDKDQKDTVKTYEYVG